MRNLIKVLVIFLMVSNFMPMAFAHQLGFELSKQVNGDYKQAFVVNFKPLRLPTVYLNTSCVFVAPRSRPLAGNHEYFEAIVGGEFGLLGGALDLSTGVQRYWEGNSRGLPEGYMDWTNNASLMWSW